MTWTGERPGLGIWSTNDALMGLMIVAAAGFDYVALDLQHGYLSMGALPQAIANVRGPQVLVRVPRNRPEFIGRALDAGAHGVIIPMVGSAEEAREAVRAAKYPPQGHRSWGPLRPSVARQPGDANSLVKVFVMVETAEGLSNVEAIADVEGLEGIYIGPNDLALSLGLGRAAIEESAILDEAVQTVLATCRERGLIAGFHADGLETAKEIWSRGFSMITVATDTSLLQAALKQVADALGRSGDGGQAY